MSPTRSAGKVRGAGQTGAVHEDRNWNYSDVSTERLCDFQADKIVLVVQTSLSIGIDRGQPTSPDHRDERLHFRERLLNQLLEVDSRLDGVDIHEHVLGAKVLF